MLTSLQPYLFNILHIFNFFVNSFYLKEHKQNERLALEKEIEHQKQMELELHSAKQVTKEKVSILYSIITF